MGWRPTTSPLAQRAHGGELQPLPSVSRPFPPPLRPTPSTAVPHCASLLPHFTPKRLRFGCRRCALPCDPRGAAGLKYGRLGRGAAQQRQSSPPSSASRDATQGWGRAAAPGAQQGGRSTALQPPAATWGEAPGREPQHPPSAAARRGTVTTIMLLLKNKIRRGSGSLPRAQTSPSPSPPTGGTAVFPPLRTARPYSRSHNASPCLSTHTPEPSPRLPSPPPSHEAGPAGRAPSSPQRRAGGGDGGSRAGLCPPGGHKRCRSSSTVPLQFCCSRAGMRCRRFGAKLSKLCGPAKQMRALQAKTPRCDTNKRVLIVQKGRRCFSASLQPPTALLR